MRLATLANRIEEHISHQFQDGLTYLRPLNKDEIDLVLEAYGNFVCTWRAYGKPKGIPLHSFVSMGLGFERILHEDIGSILLLKFFDRIEVYALSLQKQEIDSRATLQNFPSPYTEIIPRLEHVVAGFGYVKEPFFKKASGQKHPN